MSNILEITDLTKHYGDLIALNNVNLNIKKGAIYGLLGPNGAGKTTLLRIINSILLKDFGSVKINGIEVSHKTSKFLGYMPEERGLYNKMRVEDQIMYFGQLKGADKAILYKNMKEYMELFNLSGQGRRKIEELSKGNQQKVQIISTLVHQPDLVILDEPFSGFDPINGALLNELISRLNERETTIILSSHNMPAIEEMCSDIALINKGSVLLCGDLEEIKNNHKTGAIELTTRRMLNINMLLDSNLIKTIEPVNTKNIKYGYRYRIVAKPNVSNNDILSNVAYQAEILHFEELLPTLNDIFINYTIRDN